MNTIDHHSLMHGTNYAGQDVTGWLAQEKLDGRTNKLLKLKK